MSFEYISDRPVPKHLRDEVRTLLANGADYVVQKQSGGSGDVRIRYAGLERSTAWSEDALIYFEERRVLLVIHAGSGQQRSVLVQFVEGVLQTLGVTSTFVDA